MPIIDIEVLVNKALKSSQGVRLLIRELNKIFDDFEFDNENYFSEYEIEFIPGPEFENTLEILRDTGNLDSFLLENK
jgi:hypothetical protein